jgi:hypothetical protein
MKKIYMTPCMTVVKLQHQHIICFSQEGMETTLLDEEVDEGWTKEYRRNVWDEEW